jgi:hypothetical protein
LHGKKGCDNRAEQDADLLALLQLAFNDMRGDDFFCDGLSHTVSLKQENTGAHSAHITSIKNVFFASAFAILSAFMVICKQPFSRSVQLMKKQAKIW